jgi:2-polyprenyl-3-methyl-5-hydroxy-6-metoxy-1,4-benzoquinol methylase
MQVREGTLEYDAYWQAQDVERTRARSLARASLALRLLGGDQGGRRRLLDVGCGPGWALEAFAAAGFDAHGVDVSVRAVQEAERRGLQAQVLDVERDELPGGFDVVAALEVLEHLRDPLAVLRRLGASLASGGRAVVSLPNEFHLLSRLRVLAGRPSFSGHAHPHLRLFDEAAAHRLFAAAGFAVLGRLSDSIVPPRRAVLRWISAPALRVARGLFALSHVFLLGGAGGEVGGER